ncbi:MAG: hypothetical protein ACP5NY_09145, partial [Thermocladium sp.]
PIQREPIEHVTPPIEHAPTPIQHVEPVPVAPPVERLPAPIHVAPINHEPTPIEHTPINVVGEPVKNPPIEGKPIVVEPVRNVGFGLPRVVSPPEVGKPVLIVPHTNSGPLSEVTSHLSGLESRRSFGSIRGEPPSVKLPIASLKPQSPPAWNPHESPSRGPVPGSPPSLLVNGGSLGFALFERVLRERNVPLNYRDILNFIEGYGIPRGEAIQLTNRFEEYLTHQSINEAQQGLRSQPAASTAASPPSVSLPEYRAPPPMKLMLPQLPKAEPPVVSIKAESIAPLEAQYKALRGELESWRERELQRIGPVSPRNPLSMAAASMVMTQGLPEINFSEIQAQYNNFANNEAAQQFVNELINELPRLGSEATLPNAVYTLEMQAALLSNALSYVSGLHGEAWSDVRRWLSNELSRVRSNLAPLYTGLQLQGMLGSNPASNAELLVAAQEAGVPSSVLQPLTVRVFNELMQTSSPTAIPYMQALAAINQTLAPYIKQYKQYIQSKPVSGGGGAFNLESLLNRYIKISEAGGGAWPVIYTGSVDLSAALRGLEEAIKSHPALMGRIPGVGMINGEPNYDVDALRHWLMQYYQAYLSSLNLRGAEEAVQEAIKSGNPQQYLGGLTNAYYGALTINGNTVPLLFIPELNELYEESVQASLEKQLSKQLSQFQLSEASVINTINKAMSALNPPTPGVGGTIPVTELITGGGASAPPPALSQVRAALAQVPSLEKEWGRINDLIKQVLRSGAALPSSMVTPGLTLNAPSPTLLQNTLQAEEQGISALSTIYGQPQTTPITGTGQQNIEVGGLLGQYLTPPPGVASVTTGLSGQRIVINPAAVQAAYISTPLPAGLLQYQPRVSFKAPGNIRMIGGEPAPTRLYL